MGAGDPADDQADEARRRVLRDPSDAAACADVVRGRRDGAGVYRWFRRLTALPSAFATGDILMVDGDVLRRALRATATVEIVELRRLANSVPLRHRSILGFVGAALVANRRVDLDALAALPLRFADARDNFDRLIAILSENAVPDTVDGAYTMTLAKQSVGSTLRSAGLAEPAARLELNVSRFMRRVRRNLYGEAFRVFRPQWTAAIGHQVLLAFLLRGQAGGVFDFRGAKVVGGRIANPFLWELTRTLSPDVEVVSGWTGFADSHSSRHLEWIEGRFVDCFEACGVVADRLGDHRGAILPGPERTHPVLAGFLAAAGIAADERIVTLHCREAGFSVNRRHDLRNADIANWLPAVTRLVARGYRVVRLGDRSMTPLPAIAGVIDYATSGQKSDALDVLLPAAAAFHIGSSSGLSLVPLLFGVPCLFLDWYPFDLLPWGRRNWTVLKTLTALADGRRITDRATYGPLGRLRDRRLLRALGHDAHDLRPAEITRAVEDFALALEGAPGAPPKSGRNEGRLLVADDSGGLLDLV
jgi:putative glycosyltransferase (TIGR04372 family)